MTDGSGGAGRRNRRVTPDAAPTGAPQAPPVNLTFDPPGQDAPPTEAAPRARRGLQLPRRRAAPTVADAPDGTVPPAPLTVQPPAAVVPDPGGEVTPEGPARRGRLRAWRGWRPLLAAALVAGAGVGAWFALPVRTVQVGGNARLSEARVQELAGLREGFGWLYYGAWRARGLLDSPWVASARVVRVFPDTVRVEVTERMPRVRLARPDGSVVVAAADGTVLPGAALSGSLPLVSGWGPDRLPDVLRVLGALSGYNVQSVVFTPTGLSVKLPSGSVWSGDLQALLKYAGSISMYPNSDISIYPWGVSVQE
ncbi:FtsQ-type POTRA domain-containing protein [Deinococcus sp. LM3]|uniref:cell division protein FtsQ/DivIB n=1 Tax=Deinococcus sp. LM3 TaxID=1938608 RepID=UPI001F0B49BC|nr:FtsQ-type POTRA domain-containing protein [Deinococcus sp. LM3]